jgi:hypothetical protein
MTKRAIILSVAVFVCFLASVFALIIVSFMPQTYVVYRFLALPLALSIVLLIAALRSEKIDLIKYLNEKGNKEGYPFIAVLYIGFLKKKYNKIIVWLSIITFIILFLSMFVDIFMKNLLIVIFPLCIILLLMLRSKIVSTRITAGVFGTNADEVKELINFMLSNYENINFTDDDGNIKKSFLPETLHPDKYIADELEGATSL